MVTPSVAVPVDYDFVEILSAIAIPEGGHAWVDDGRLYVAGVTQAEVDEALAQYDHSAVVQAGAVAAFVARLERHYDETAQARRYDNRFTCALRAGYAGPFQGEGASFAVWMDECNAYAYAQMAAVMAAERTKPTPEELIAELPEMVWPV